MFYLVASSITRRLFFSSLSLLTLRKDRILHPSPLPLRLPLIRRRGSLFCIILSTSFVVLSFLIRCPLRAFCWASCFVSSRLRSTSALAPPARSGLVWSGPGESRARCTDQVKLTIHVWLSHADDDASVDSYLHLLTTLALYSSPQPAVSPT